ncbi:aspartyl protease family protein [uncultured Winogradskyella sp.]|uniref:aspartyl protease family protein n=1 Tax=uncultured Winogradskyella sp. TaxID=395353 RepID=UPI0026172356|nr:aspartyl protease family protein [uncultured Winogradskyella sp.]
MKTTIFKYCLFALLFSIATSYAQDTIPFNLGKDNRIYLKATVNDSEPLIFIFDTGANAMVVNTTKTNSKLNLKFNSETENTGANGTINQKVSTSNTLQIGKFKRTNEDIIGIPYSAEHYTFDGVIGYPFFEDYLIEINYKLHKLVLHSSLKTITNLKSYDKTKMGIIQEVPFIDFTIIKANNMSVTFPALIDTGFNGELIVYHKTVTEFKLSNHFEKIGAGKSQGTDGTIIHSDQVIIPKVKIGDVTIKNTIASLNKTSTNTEFTAILGGEILKNINWILDFKKKRIYTISK